MFVPHRVPLPAAPVRRASLDPIGGGPLAAVLDPRGPLVPLAALLLAAQIAAAVIPHQAPFATPYALHAAANAVRVAEAA